MPSIFHEKRLVCAQVGETVFSRFGQTAQSHKRGAAAFSSAAQSGMKRPPAPSTVLRISKLSSESTVAERAFFIGFFVENDRFKPRRPLQRQRGNPQLRQLRSPAEDVFFFIVIQNTCEYLFAHAELLEHRIYDRFARVLAAPERSLSNFPYHANIPRPSAPAALSGGGCVFLYRDPKHL